MILAAQAVPSAAQVPCVAELPSGWEVSGADIASGSREVLAGLRPGRLPGRDGHPVRELRRVRCAADPVRRAGHAPVRAPRRAWSRSSQTVRFYTFPGGCATYRFDFAPRHVLAARDPRRRRRVLRAQGRPRGPRPEHRGPGAVRAWCAMPRMSRQRDSQAAEHALLPSPGGASPSPPCVVALTRWCSPRWRQRRAGAPPASRSTTTGCGSWSPAGRRPVTAAAVVLDLLGLVYVTLPVRIAIAGFLALRRRWWHLAAFVAAVLMSEVLIGTLKSLYDRPRPPGSLVATSGASFPSGHSVAASVTVVAAVIALVPPGRHRAAWGARRRRVLDPDGSLAGLPRRPLAVRRRRRRPARYVVRAARRARGRCAPAPLGRAAGGSIPAVAQAPDLSPRRGPTMTGAPVAAPVRRLLPASRYRHPGDVIRLISAGTRARRGARTLGGRIRVAARAGMRPS